MRSMVTTLRGKIYDVVWMRWALSPIYANVPRWLRACKHACVRLYIIYTYVSISMMHVCNHRSIINDARGCVRNYANATAITYVFSMAKLTWWWHDWRNSSNIIIYSVRVYHAHLWEHQYVSCQTKYYTHVCARCEQFPVEDHGLLCEGVAYGSLLRVCI